MERDSMVASAPEVAFLFCVPSLGKVKHIKYYIYD